MKDILTNKENVILSIADNITLKQNDHYDNNAGMLFAPTGDLMLYKQVDVPDYVKENTYGYDGVEFKKIHISNNTPATKEEIMALGQQITDLELLMIEGMSNV